MKQLTPHQELHHEIFGSILDRGEMTPYLLMRTKDYDTALRQTTRMLGNRGFDVFEGKDLQEGERERALKYIDQARDYILKLAIPFLKSRLTSLLTLQSENRDLYRNCLHGIGTVEEIFYNGEFRRLISEDPRHLFLLASSRKYPHVFYGYQGKNMDVPIEWQQASCSILKMCHLIKSVEEESQDIHDYAQLGLFLEMQGQSLHDLYSFDWEHPSQVPESESAKRAYVKISTFFHRLKESLSFDSHKGCLVFNSGDGVDVDIAAIRSRLKSPESMYTKLGKNLEGEAHSIRDILAITFILKRRDDTLKLFHALQKRGLILQENTVSQSITQTLFDTPVRMVPAVKGLMASLSKSEGAESLPDEGQVQANAETFYRALSVNAAINPHSSAGHKKFQCKINFYVPIHRTADTNEIIIPGTPLYRKRHRIEKKTGQHTLPLELRISDEQSWQDSEQRGDSHHDAYKFRQLVVVMNRILKGVFHFPDKGFMQLRHDQRKLYPETEGIEDPV